MENVWPAVPLSADLEAQAIHGNPHLTRSFKGVTGFCARASFDVNKCSSIRFCLLSIHSSPRKNTGKFHLVQEPSAGTRAVHAGSVLCSPPEQGLGFGSSWSLQGIWIWRFTCSLQEITETTWICLDVDWTSLICTPGLGLSPLEWAQVIPAVGQESARPKDRSWWLFRCSRLALERVWL